MKRKDGEDFDKYKERRRIGKMITDFKMRWVFVWVSKTHGDKPGSGKTYQAGRDQLYNSRAQANKLEALKRKRENAE